MAVAADTVALDIIYEGLLFKYTNLRLEYKTHTPFKTIMANSIPYL